MFKKISKFSLITIISMITLSMFGGCTFTEIFTGVDVVATQQRIAMNIRTTMDEYPLVVKIIEKHSKEFNKDEITSLKDIDNLFNYAINRLKSFKTTNDVEMIDNFQAIYDDLQFVWKSVNYSYEKNFSIIEKHKDVFTLEEYMRIRKVDNMLRSTDADIKRLINKANKTNENIKQIVEDALTIAKIALTINAAINGDPNAIMQSVEFANSINSMR